MVCSSGTSRDIDKLLYNEWNSPYVSRKNVKAEMWTIGRSVFRINFCHYTFNGIIRTLAYLPVRICGECACRFASLSCIDYIITWPLLAVSLFFHWRRLHHACSTWDGSVECLCGCYSKYYLFFYFPPRVLPFSPVARYMGAQCEHGHWRNGDNKKMQMNCECEGPWSLLSHSCYRCNFFFFSFIQFQQVGEIVGVCGNCWR